MSRKRYISTDISTDIRMAELAEHGTLPLLLFTWSIPHFDDWGRMSGDPRQFKLTVCPGLDYSSSDVLAAIEQISNVGLWHRYQADGKWVLAIPSKSWFKHQSYIGKEKRNNDEGSNFKSMEFAENPADIEELPQNAEEHRETPRNASSFSFSSSLSSSVSYSKDSSSRSSGRDNPFSLFETHGFGKLDTITRDFIGTTIDDYGEDWTIRAIKETVKQNKIVWKYVERILQRWKSTGHLEPWTLEKAEDKPTQNGNVARFPYQKSQKPSIPMITPDSKSAAPTPEELEAMKQRALRLDEKFNKQVHG